VLAGLFFSFEWARVGVRTWCGWSRVRAISTGIGIVLASVFRIVPDFWWAMNAMIFGAATRLRVRARPTGSSSRTCRYSRIALDAGGA